MDPVEALKTEFYAKWVAEDGLAMLHPNDTRVPFPGQDLSTVENENGILFLSIFYGLCSIKKNLNQMDFMHFESTVKRLEVTGQTGIKIPGLYNRHPGNITRTEAHDNYVGVVTTSVLMAEPFVNDVLKYGNSHGFVFDNVNPGRIGMAAQRQGGEVAFYKICADEIPTMWEMAWLIIGMLLNAVKSSPSDAQLTWLRQLGIQAALREKTNTLPQVYRLAWGAAYGIWFLASRVRWGSVPGGMFANYFRDDHPIRRMASLI